jgi:hypothetical protein
MLILLMIVKQQVLSLNFLSQPPRLLLALRSVVAELDMNLVNVLSFGVFQI